MTMTAATSVQGEVDRQLLEQGAFTPLELLLENGRLVYSDYEDWRQGDIEYLDGVLSGNPQRVREQVQLAVDYARRIRLVAEEQSYTRWGENHSGTGQTPVTLRFSADERFHRLVCQRFVAAGDVPQLDMFFDNPAVVLINGLTAALANREPVRARHALDQLYQQSPNHPELAAFDRLLAALQQGEDEVEDVCEELVIVQTIAPLAQRLLGAQSRDYLVPQWRRLVPPLTGQGFDPGEPDLHLSHVLAQVQDWAGVSTAIRAQPAWWEHAVLCQRLAESGYRRGDRIESISGWSHLCWLHPADAYAALSDSSLPDRGIGQLWQQYLDIEDVLLLQEPVDSADFPAWLLLREPGLAHSLPVTLPAGDSPAERAYRLAHQLVLARSSQEGEREVDLRQALQEVHPDLFQYFKSRL